MFQKIFLMFQRLFGEPVYLGLSSCSVSDMDNSIHPATQCMIHLIISEMEKSHHAQFANENPALVAFYIGCFIEDYENYSLTFAISSIANTLDLIITEHRQYRETGTDPEILSSISRNGLALTAVADCIRRANVVLDGGR